MNPQEVAEIETWLKSEDNEISFARHLFGNDEVDQLKETIRASVGYMEEPGVAQYRGGEFAARWLAVLGEWNERKLDELKTVVSEKVCPTVSDIP
jgi:hypothetical protein